MTFLPFLLALFLDIYALYNLWHEKPSPRRLLFWIAVILLFPAVGAIIYLLFFRRRPE